MIFLKAFILSLIQSFTEFIPVSSSAHLILLSKYLKFDNNDGNLFFIMIQLASMLAVCFFFKNKLFSVAFSLHKNKSSRKFAYKFILAFLPCAFFGLLFYKYIKTYLNGNLTIGISLILGGFLFLIIDKFPSKIQFSDINKVNYLTSLKIGIYQILSMIPGVSRSGSTIVGGLLCGLNRKTAVEFSFILAIPTIFSATILDFYKNIHHLNINNLPILLFGFITTFIISQLVIKFFINYITYHNFHIFAYYRIILGIIILSL